MAWPRGFIWRSDRFVEPFYLSLQHGNGHAQLSVGLGPPGGLACHTARQRVADVLLTLARTIGQEVSGGIALRISNEDLANAANVSRFTASRLVSEWHRKRALVKRRGNVLLLSPDQISSV